jgi:uncharacterized protein YdeI (YjbR/CyaY-like superfamily)
MSKAQTYVTFSSRDEWRAWLEENHAHEKEVWVIHYKKASGKQGLTVSDAVEEALCFGWIDGILKRIDAEKHVVRYSPRRARSIWSQINKGRVARLIQEGRMTAAGLAKVAQAKECGQWQAATQREDVDTILADVERALRRHKGMLKAFRSLAPSHRKQYLWWIDSAKRAETRQKRIAALIDYLAGRGKPLGG